MKKPIVIVFFMISSFCWGQNQSIYGTYEANKKLHLFNPICSKNKLIISPDSTWTFIDCDWIRNDTLDGKCLLDKQTITLINFGKHDLKLFYKNGFLFRSKTRRFLSIKDYKKTSN